ncbi:MAG: substrate-binding domain-containing protein [Clostridia bacterium]|nr:substrate-binding domain-containing protein [Clostridia bacterium]
MNIATVVLDAYFEEISADYVLINNVQGAFLATDYLARCGHRSIGHLKSNVYISNFGERANGYYNALRKHGIDTSHSFVIPLSPQTEQGYADMVKYLEKEPRLATAYFADNDIIAVAALRGFAKFGYNCPNDISVIGFDDMPFCQLTTPPISTMRVPKRDLGRIAVKRLLEKIQIRESDFMKISIATQLIERESVKKLNP